MRNTDPLTEELRRWGHAQVNRFALSRADRSVHVLDKVRDHAPLTRERAIQDLVGRDGTDRRRLMAAGAGVKGLRIVPLWAADPIRASSDADHPHATQRSRSMLAFRMSCVGSTEPWHRWSGSTQCAL
ncbi:TPA: hypothetical protein ACGCEE_000071 [Stenotrophomonas maltophilia]|uniref:hypothetical protein n=1 Tax=Stenotrophomonas maltophilia TaxID=40324 RepID=UPI001F53B9DD|nr:hypothetical protein [Stenotrophomonas maltophilia]MCI1157053.1 hypothetical protein [Stenotrophomonas maltophilia]